jgi:uncharacterized membrane protein
MDTKKIKTYFITLAIVLILDFIWLFLIMKSFYDNQLSNFLRPENIPIWSAIFAWALIPLGIVLFVDKLAKNNKQIIIYGALYGFILYGLYDFTNYAILANWPLQMVIVDVLWGIILCSLSSIIMRLINKKWLK